jgi:hypothetical protein
MRSLGPEHIVLLLVILVPLVILLVRWPQGRARKQGWAEPVVREERPATPMPPRPRVIEPALPDETRHGEAAPRAVLPASRLDDRRTPPLGGRAAVRQAVIAMTILGSCRGLEEPPPSRSPARRPASLPRP